MTITIEPGITIEKGIIIGSSPVVTPRVAHSVAAVGNAQVSTTQVKFGTGSYTSNNLVGSLKVTPVSDFAFGTKDFTVEFWHYPTTLAGYQAYFGTRPLSTNGRYPAFVLNNNGTGTLQYYVQGFKITTTASLTINSWNSIALVRRGTTTTIYVNGNNAGNPWTTDTTDYLASTCIFFGDDYAGGNGLPIRGYTDEVRISNIARYTGNYTPATQPFVSDNNTLLLIHCDGTNGSTAFTDTVSI